MLGNKDVEGTGDAGSHISYGDLGYVYIGAPGQLKGIFIYQLNYNLGVTFRIQVISLQSSISKYLCCCDLYYT